METVGVNFLKLVAPSFHRAHYDIVASRDTDPTSPTYGLPLREYWFRGGRGCVDGDTLIDTPHGQIKIKDFKGGPVFTLLKDGTVGIREADAATKYKIENLFRVSLANGKSVLVTDEHRFLVKDQGWVQLKDIILKNISDTRVEIAVAEVVGEKCGYVGITSIIYEKSDYYYDIYVADTHNFIGDGIVHHNSTKSSFISLEIIRHLCENPQSNAVIFMKVAENIRDSVYKQICWAIDHLELNAFFKYSVSPFSCVYSRTQDWSLNSPDRQEIIFRGLDKAGKIKGIKPRRGYFDQIWFEEVTEFNGMEDIRSVIQSVLRGGDEKSDDGGNVRTWEYYSYNPPPTLSNWVNAEASKTVEGRKIYTSNYLSVPERWLGKNFFARAANLKKDNPRAYAHEYLGWITGTGNNVFNNLEIRDITDEEIKTKFDNRCFGIDWGFAGDPFVWLAMNYDRNHQTLYIFDEIYALGMRTQETAELVRKKMERVGGNIPIYADCAEPDSIADYNNWGVKVIGCPKPHGNKWSGRDYEFQCLQDLKKIVIDKTYCPKVAAELSKLEFPKTPSGETKHEYPHTDGGDAVRYGTFFKLRDAGLLPDVITKQTKAQGWS